MKKDSKSIPTVLTMELETPEQSVETREWDPYPPELLEKLLDHKNRSAVTGFIRSFGKRVEEGMQYQNIG
jgi:DNA polymerase II large subunit